MFKNKYYKFFLFLQFSEAPFPLSYTHGHSLTGKEGSLRLQLPLFPSGVKAGLAAGGEGLRRRRPLNAGCVCGPVRSAGAPTAQTPQGGAWDSACPLQMNIQQQQATRRDLALYLCQDVITQSLHLLSSCKTLCTHHLISPPTFGLSILRPVL